MQHTYYRTSVSESDLIGDVCWDLLVIFMFTTQVLEDVFFCHFFLSNLLESMILWRVLQDTLGTCYTVLVHKRIWWSTVICQHSLKNVRFFLKKQNIISWYMNCWWVTFFQHGTKVIYTKYSKHWPYTVAHTLDYVCSKINYSWFNPWFSFYFSSLYPAPYIEWDMC